jgi:energy-converting hydrogenase Eha subunit B
VLKIEDAIALNYEPTVQQTIGRASLGSLVALTYFYAIGMWVGLIAMAVILFIKNRSMYVYLRRMFVLSMLLATVVFTVFPLAPPRFMPGLGVTDTVTLLGLDHAPASDSAVSYN